MTLERLWAGWRSDYLDSGSGSGPGDGCVFCAILASGAPDEETHLLWQGRATIAILNAYPYTSGHFMVLPRRHVGEVEDLDHDEAAELWTAVADGVRAVKAAYRPEGVNLGANIGQAAGAGVPGHFHVHVLPRWRGDTNFMTTVAGARVLPEALPVSGQRLRAAWPRSSTDG